MSTERDAAEWVGRFDMGRVDLRTEAGKAAIARLPSEKAVYFAVTCLFQGPHHPEG